jgi:CBS-domain-containing membrane protein
MEVRHRYRQAGVIPLLLARKLQALGVMMIPVAREIGKGRSVKVKEIMTTRVVTVTPDTPVPVIASLLRDNRISGVPVTGADGAVVGLVSEYDLLAREGETAGEVMTGSVITVSEDTDVEDVRHLLVERRIRRVPVMSGPRLAGIVSRGDVVALLTTEWVCQVCGEAARGQHPPSRCPRCHAGSGRFTLQDACPGD